MDLENKNINNLRMLAVDMIENAGSGHPGIALGCAPTMYALYSKILNVVPDEPENIFRDRFVMSAGHGSSIYYATLHAFGYDLSMEDLKNFRKNNSKTPGHPEYGVVPGVDMTTGPLGQGVSSAVGMAIAERFMASRFNKPDITLFDNYTYALVGEGCLMEGVSYESLSLAGSLKLNKLIILYDCNNITLDGNTKNVMEMNISAYMKSLGFNTLEVIDGNDVSQITQAIMLAKQSKDKPSFIKINTHIGYGSVYQDNNKSHGSCLGVENTELLRKKLGVNSKAFELEKDVVRDLTLIKKRFSPISKGFKEKLKVYSRAYPGDFKALQEFIKKDFSKVEECLKNIDSSEQKSGRDLGNIVLQEIANNYQNIVSGSADLFSSTKTLIKDSQYFNENTRGKNIKYGIREFAMGCISNGIALYGGIVPISSTFMVFSDYLKPAIRVGSIMKQKMIYVFTHDSIAVGEDGATHQPCEQLWTLRSIPNTKVFRPANMDEVKSSYSLALQSETTSCIILSRQTLKAINSDVSLASKGGYVFLSEEKGSLDGIIVATGSEVSLACDIKENLKKEGLNIRVVSMPSVEVFLEQSEKYQNSVIPNDMKAIFSIEAGSTYGWYRFVGKYGKCYGVDDFGGSAKPDELFEKFNLTKEFITKDILKTIKKIN